MITVNSRSYDGAVRKSWKCELIERSGNELLLRGEFDNEVEHPDLGLIRRGTVSFEYYWLDRWFNVFRFHEPGGELRNFYCNISMLPEYAADVLDYVDLDIDILVQPDFSYSILDREDFEANARRFDYPDAVRTKVEETVRDLVRKLDRHEFPNLFATPGAL